MNNTSRITCLQVAYAACLQEGKTYGNEKTFTCPRHDDKHPSLKINTMKDVFMCGPCQNILGDAAVGNYWALAAFFLRVDGNSSEGKKEITEWLKTKGFFSANGNAASQYGRPINTPSLEQILHIEEPTISAVQQKMAHDTDDLPNSYKGLPIERWFPYQGFDVAKIPTTEFKSNGKQKYIYLPYRQGEWGIGDYHPTVFQHETMDGATLLYIVEGEAKAELLQESGLIAISAPGCKRGDEDFIRYAKSIPETVIKVYISADNDQTGQSYADRWIKVLKLYSQVQEIRVSYCLPGIELKGGDIIDFKESNGDKWKQLFDNHFEDITPWIRSHEDPVERPKHLQFLTGNDFFENIPKLLWLIDGLFVLPSLNIVFGKGGSKKSYSMLDLAIRVANGMPWLNRKTKQSPVLWIDQEGGEVRTRIRVAEVYRGHLSDRNAPFFASVFPGYNFSKPEKAIVHLEEAVEATKAKLVIMDSLAAITPGIDENSSETMGPVLYALRSLAEKHSLCIIVIHHESKAGSYRGSSALQAAADCMLKVTSEPKAKLVNFAFEKARDTDGKPFVAESHFREGEFYLSATDITPQDKPKFTEPQQWVLNFLKSRPKHQATMQEIKEAANPELPAPSCSAKTAEKETRKLVKSGHVENVNPGTGRNHISTYRLKEEIPTPY